jgi:hypothetical protein
VILTTCFHKIALVMLCSTHHMKLKKKNLWLYYYYY